jgi:hypothetical protein
MRSEDRAGVERPRASNTAWAEAQAVTGPSKDGSMLRTGLRCRDPKAPLNGGSRPKTRPPRAVRGRCGTLTAPKDRQALSGKDT